MCWQCHQGFSDEDIVQQLSLTLENPRYEEWNETSFSHMWIAAAGFNGLQAREMSLKLLDGYCDSMIEKVKDNSVMVEQLNLLSALIQTYKKMVMPTTPEGWAQKKQEILKIFITVKEIRK